jgi:hypothetical protein
VVDAIGRNGRLNAFYSALLAGPLVGSTANILVLENGRHRFEPCGHGPHASATGRAARVTQACWAKIRTPPSVQKARGAPLRAIVDGKPAGRIAGVALRTGRAKSLVGDACAGCTVQIAKRYFVNDLKKTLDAPAPLWLTRNKKHHARGNRARVNGGAYQERRGNQRSDRQGH